LIFQSSKEISSFNSNAHTHTHVHSNNVNVSSNYNSNENGTEIYEKQDSELYRITTQISNNYFIVKEISDRIKQIPQEK